jgi:DMSO/TMAO reductase YedYZ heme-binding membrane subunit
MLDGWKLFWVITAPISLLQVLAMTQLDMSQAESISSMIQLSVRCAVPFLFIVFGASAVQAVFPGPLGRWLLRNRKFLGLSFAAAMAWQLFFIVWLFSLHMDYYLDEVYALSDLIEGLVGYAFLIAMTLTSFKFGRKRLTQRNWKRLHTAGIYWLWYYAWSVYWFELFYYESPALLIDFIYYWGGSLAWGLRLLAWGRRQAKQTVAQGDYELRPILLLLSIAALAIGFAGASFGASWSPLIYDILFSFRTVETLDGFVPYFPLVPFYPLLLMIAGTALFARAGLGPAPRSA